MTGDLGLLDHDGFLFLKDRSKDLIISGGESPTNPPPTPVTAYPPTLHSRCCIPLRPVRTRAGSNIYPREVEEVLLRHEAILEASVIGVPSAAWGETVLACVVPRPGSAPQTTKAVNTLNSELDTLCTQQIARFKRPRCYRYLEALPKSPNGKVLKTVLREHESEVNELISSLPIG